MVADPGQEQGVAGGEWAQGPLATVTAVARQDYPPGLYVVATPLGNAADMSIRALWVLRMADLVACEDTRTSGALLARFGIPTRRVALHRHNERSALEPLLARLQEGARIALVSDAGTPALCDPGAPLVRAALDAGVRVIPIPGPSSLTAALSVAGIESPALRFLGFAPSPARQRAAFWQEVARCPDPAVVFETPHRISGSARQIAAAMEPGRRVVIARELTKQFESVVQATAGTLPEAVAGAPERGEFVLVFDSKPVTAQTPEEGGPSVDETTRRWLDALAAELPPARAAAVAARASGLPRDLLYRALSDRGNRSPAGE
jgi:16S rRNA (cytidine1402-2'-O)-methyltransferase